MKVVVDRIEGSYAICELENLKIVNIPLDILGEIKEGDILSIDINKENNMETKERIENLVNDLFID